ncbi:hypothetical protein [Rhodopseudomonas sp. RCAM05734]|uniref:hypothetical protein n=1 Tax=Rhodopseudomonas sp. RCAM05734 TaxID=3457549 RepID=UPI0040442E09
MGPIDQRYRGLTPAQEAVLVALTDQRCANLLAAADFVADLPVHAKDFLRDAKPETLDFLRDARPEEITNLKEGIQLVVAAQLLGRVGRWVVITIFGMIVGSLLIWDRLVSHWFKTARN